MGSSLHYFSYCYPLPVIDTFLGILNTLGKEKSFEDEYYTFMFFAFSEKEQHNKTTTIALYYK